MTTTAQSGTPGAPQVGSNATPMGVCTLKGRIASKRSYVSKGGRVFCAVIKLPAPDEFSHPGTVEVQASTQFGDVGSDVVCRVRVSGFPDSYRKTDPETGESTVVQKADNTLTLVE